MTKKEQFEEQIYKKECETLKNKLALVESSRDKKNEEIKALKVKLSELEALETKTKLELNDLNAKY